MDENEEISLLIEMSNFLPEDVKPIDRFWTKTNALVGAYKDNKKHGVKYYIVRGFFLGGEPVCSVDYAGTSQRWFSERYNYFSKNRK